MMKEIQLSQSGKNKGRYVALVDDEDFERVNQFKWCVRKDRNTYYACRTINVGDKKSYMVHLHRFIMNIDKNTLYIDHRDGNGLNNQKYNLRICTQTQNLQNKSAFKNGLSKYKGVFPHQNQFTSEITINKKRIYLGSFKYEINAAKAYDKKAKELFGEFAKLNII